MKKLKLFFALSFVAVMSATTAMAQSAEATMNVTAELLSGLQITNVNALVLGSFVLASDAAPSDNFLTVSPNSSNTNSAEGVAIVTSPVAGNFQVAGTPNTNVTITISGSVDLTHTTDNASKFTLTTAVDGFSSDSDGNLTDVVLLSTLGDTSPIYVGGVLGGIDQTDSPGNYTGTINITVAY
jgi:hypothetical protein